MVCEREDDSFSAVFLLNLFASALASSSRNSSKQSRLYSVIPSMWTLPFWSSLIFSSSEI